MESDNSNSIAAKDNTRQNTSMGQPPEMNCADGETCTPPEMNCDANNENCEMPEMPAMNGGFGGFGGGRGTMMMAQGTTDSILHPAAYLAIGGGGVILGILISYACFSKFFRLKPGQTFSSLAKFIWFVVVALLIAVGVGVLGYFIPVWTK
ncbi:MAG: hypothetical protein Q4B87_02155 [Candidatus Saccharibacteria bacterium]|nr:hypothetical protein [Candidatus Saccharibacteria bacterium]